MRGASHLLSSSRRILPLSGASQKYVILSSVEPISNHHQHCLWYCSHNHKHHHSLAGSSGMAAMARTRLPAADCVSRSHPHPNSIVIDDTHTAFRHRAWLKSPVQACTSHEEPGDGHCQSHITCGRSTPKASNPGSAISHSPKDVRPLEAIPPLDLLATEPWEEVTKLSETFPSPSNRSFASSRSEIELRMPPKPTLLRNSRSLEAVPYFSLY